MKMYLFSFKNACGSTSRTAGAEKQRSSGTQRQNSKTAGHAAEKGQKPPAFRRGLLIRKEFYEKDTCT